MQDLSKAYPLRLVTDSMSGGGTVNERYSMSAPGSDPIDVMPPIATFEDLTDVGQQAGPQIPVSTEKARTNTVASVPSDGERWQTTTTTGQSYEGTSYSDQDGALH